MATTTFREKLSGFIRKAEEEVDTLRVKAALGKMEASDILEDLSRELSHNFHSILDELSKDTDDLSDKAAGYLEAIRLQLSLGKAEAEKIYEARKLALNRSINELEHWLDQDGAALRADLRLRIQNEIEKFRLKMEILRIRLELGKIEVREVADEKKSRYRKELEQILESVRDEASLKSQMYSTKLKSAYESLRKSWQTSAGGKA